MRFCVPGGKQLTTKFSVPLLGEISFDPIIREKEDSGITEAFEYFDSVLQKLEEVLDN